MTHKIAIITSGYDNYDQYGDSYRRVVESITDWDEVSDVDFKCLKAMESRLGYHVIERPLDTETFIKKTVADYKTYVRAEESRLENEKIARANAAAERKYKRDLKDKASKRKLFEKLKAELEQQDN